MLTERIGENVGHFSFKRSKIINKNLVGVEMKNSFMKMNKPFYVGNAVLESSEFHMYNFHYNVMKPVFDDRIQLLYTDMDYLLYKIHSTNPYTELAEVGQMGWFNFSNFPTEHPCHHDSNKCNPGFFKDECNARPIREFVGLHSKMYSISIEGSEKEVNVAKGVKKSVIENNLKFSNYLECLLCKQSYECKCIHSSRHRMHTLAMKKKTLSSFDNQRFLLNMMHSIPYGYRNMCS